MKKNIIIIVSVIVIFIISLLFCIYSINLNKKDKLNEYLTKDNYIPGEESKTFDIENVSYKDFTVYKSDNKEVKLSDFKDSPVMILFFNSNIEDSIEVLKKVEKMYKDYENKINFIMINTEQEIDKELENEFSIDIYYDFYKEAYRNLGISEIPSMIYIDENNEIFNAKSGFTSTDALEANLDIISNNF